MKAEIQFIQTVPVFPSSDINRDIKWHEKHTGFSLNFSDSMYASLSRNNTAIHLQWHADTEPDPLLGGSVVKIFVKNLEPLFEEFVQRGTVDQDKLHTNTPWGTNEFGFLDLNNNAI